MFGYKLVAHEGSIRDKRCSEEDSVAIRGGVRIGARGDIDTSVQLLIIWAPRFVTGILYARLNILKALARCLETIGAPSSPLAMFASLITVVLSDRLYFARGRRCIDYDTPHQANVPVGEFDTRRTMQHVRDLVGRELLHCLPDPAVNVLGTMYRDLDKSIETGSVSSIASSENIGVQLWEFVVEL